MEKYNVYKDIKARTGGEIYLGVVGPVRTGKSKIGRASCRERVCLYV